MNFIKEENRIYSLNAKNEIVAEITFEEIKKGVYNINHTFVDETLRGHGIAKKLVDMAIEEIKNRNCKIVATCSYAKRYIES